MIDLHEEWGVQFERKDSPTMDNPSGIVTNTAQVINRALAEQAVSNKVPLNSMNRRVVRRLVTDWTEPTTFEQKAIERVQ